jgi:hypothetical protein
MGPFGVRRSALAAAPLAFFLIVAGGGVARALMPDAPTVKPQPAKPAAARPAAPAAPAAGSAAPAAGSAAPIAGGGAAVIEEPLKPKKQVVARAEKKPEKAAAAKAPGRLELAVAPWGEVLVDGKSRGLSPPLRVLEVPPGPHTVEIRNSTFPAHVARIEVKPGETVKIQHRFR